MPKKTLKRQLIGKVDSIGSELNFNKNNKYDIFIVVKIKLRPENSIEAAEESIKKMSVLNGKDVSLFIP